MRFDDGIDTVLAAEMSGPAGVQATWRQLVDLIGRRRARAEATAAGVARLRAIRADVPVAVRAASTRGLAQANPPAALVAMLAEDEVEVAGPVVRIARMTAPEWIALLPRMRPGTRGVLRHRRDLSEHVERALAAFGPSDFALPSNDWLPPVIDAPVAAGGEVPLPPEPVPQFINPDTARFVTLSDVVRDLPVVAEAIRLEQSAPAGPVAPARKDLEIAGIVARIEAHQRAVETRTEPVLPAADVPRPDRFRFETDACGLIRWTDSSERGPLIGLSLAAGRDGIPATADGNAGGALLRRTRFTDARLLVPGYSPVAGAWRISAIPAFDHATGRFTGYRGTARRPRPDEDPRAAGATPATDTLRQLVHELRTPANAISGFAEMIEHQLLGPVPAAYRERAVAIQTQTGGLLGAIDDIDIAARLESHSLEWRTEAVPLAPLIAQAERDLRPLADLRGATLLLTVAPDAIAKGDVRALERLFGRLLTALVAAAARGETVRGMIVGDGAAIRGELSRPVALAVPSGALFSADAEVEATADDEPLLGGGFAFRLARRLVGELGGTLTIGPESLTLRLPAAVNGPVEQATV